MTKNLNKSEASQPPSGDLRVCAAPFLSVRDAGETPAYPITLLTIFSELQLRQVGIALKLSKINAHFRSLLLQDYPKFKALTEF